MSDVFETDNGLNPFDPEDANLDPDNDGLTNLEEFQKDPDLNVNDPDTDNDEIQDNLDNLPTVSSNLCGGMDFIGQLGVFTMGEQCGALNSVRFVSGMPGTVIGPMGSLEVISPNVFFESGFTSEGQLNIKTTHPCPICLP